MKSEKLNTKYSAMIGCVIGHLFRHIVVGYNEMAITAKDREILTQVSNSDLQSYIYEQLNDAKTDAGYSKARALQDLLNKRFGLETSKCQMLFDS